MSNLEALPDLQSEASVHARIARKISHLGVTAAGLSGLYIAAEYGYRMLEQMPTPSMQEAEVHYPMLAMAASTTLATASIIYEKVVLHRNGLTTQNLMYDEMTILEPRER